MFFRKIMSLILAAGLALALPTAAAAKEAEPVHILLIGHDRQEAQSGSRADCILLCSYLPEKGELVMTSFLRDLYVPIPGHGSNRLNAAYAFGGRQLLKKTLTENFGIPLDGCVEVDFSQFAQLVDAMGGVTLTLRADEAAHINHSCGGSLTQGQQLLSGPEALAYCRIRTLDPDGDFSRTLRQQRLLQALLQKWRGARPASLMKTAKELLGMVSTDLDPGKILHWAFSLAPSMSTLELSSLRIPAPGTFREEMVQNMAVLVPDISANRRLLAQTLID